MKRFTLDEIAMILIDQRVGSNTWACSTPLALLQRNVMVLARFAAGTGMPVVLTSTKAIVAELVHNWTSKAGRVAFPLLT